MRTKRVLGWITTVLACAGSISCTEGSSRDAVQRRADAPAVQDRQSHPVIEDRERSMRVENAIRRGDLHDAALFNGGELISEANLEPDVAPADIGTSSVFSDAILVGEAATSAQGQAISRPAISRDGRTVNTYLKIRVLETIKGSLPAMISLEVPGGRIEFPDGAIVDIRTPGFSIEPGRRYLFFARKTVASGPLDPVPLPAYALVNGIRGVVDITGLTVSSMASQPPPFVGENVVEFMSRLRLALLKPTC